MPASQHSSVTRSLRPVVFVVCLAKVTAAGLLVANVMGLAPSMSDTPATVQIHLADAR